MVSDKILTLIFVQENFIFLWNSMWLTSVFASIFVPINKFWKGLAVKIVKKRSFDVVHGPNYFRL